ncbi:sensor histidine kinase [Gramella jeungdoensis]
MVWIKYIATYLLISQNVWPEGPETTRFTLNWAIVMMLGELYVISFVTAIKITVDWLRENRRSTQLKKAQLESELRFLRTQISPHFLFNTLNNIYSLSLEKSDKVPETIIKLSEFMKYLLYGTHKDKHSLKKEIDCIENYIALESIRHGDKLKLEMEINGESKEKKIRPMILIPFIENAFKHGANQSVNSVEIKIFLNIEGDLLKFKVTNTMPSEQLNKHEVGGIGVSNVKKRLSLSYSKNDYHLNIKKKSNKFIVELNLKLT